jgi:hypothetical protein
MPHNTLIVLTSELNTCTLELNLGEATVQYWVILLSEMMVIVTTAAVFSANQT